MWLAGEVKSPPFSGDARLEAGFLLRRLERGENLSMPHSRPMPPIGRGCHELRIVDQGAAWRIMYFVDRDAVVWKTGDARDFLGLSDAEAEFIEMKLALAADLRARRVAQHLNQTQVARMIGSSQSRVAKMEAADASVSLDLLIKALLKLGAERRDVAKAVLRRIAVGAS